MKYTRYAQIIHAIGDEKLGCSSTRYARPMCPRSTTMDSKPSISVTTAVNTARRATFSNRLTRNTYTSDEIRNDPADSPMKYTYAATERPHVTKLP